MDITDLVGAAVYQLTREERMGLMVSEARNIITNLRPAIEAAAHAAMAREREADVAALRAFSSRYSGTAETDVFARIVIGDAIAALRKGQADRAGRCGKALDCGSGCSLPVGHAPPCSCQFDGSDCPAD